MNSWIRKISRAGKAIITIAMALAVLSMFATPALSGHWGGHGGGYGYAYHGHGRYVRPGYHHGYRYGWGGYYRPYGYYYPAAVYASPPVVYAPPPVVVAPVPPPGISFVFPIRIH